MENDKIAQIFTEETTHKHDFTPHDKLYTRTSDEFPSKRLERIDWADTKRKLSVPLDLESLTPMRKKISFNVFVDLVSISHINFYKEKIDYKPPEEENLEDHVKNRPRVYKSPQLCLDNISDPEKRQVLIDYVYTTDFRKSDKEVLSLQHKRNKFTTKITGNEKQGPLDVQVKQQDIPPIKPEKSYKTSSKWDNEQLVGIVQNTELFWQNKDVKCGACVNPFKNLVTPEKKQEIQHLIKSNSLRVPHEITKSGYGGYKPSLATGVDLLKKNLSCSHPLMSVNQVVQKRKEI